MTDKKTYLLLAVLFALFVIGVYAYVPINGVDWEKVYRPVTLALINGGTPYGVTELPFTNPPWVLLPMLPLLLLSPEMGSAVMFVANAFAFVYVAVRFRVHPLLVPVFIFATMNGLFNANIEGLVALGFILPPQIGLFFLLAKPQVGIAAAVFIAAQAWRVGGVKQVARVFAPVTIALALSVALYGMWMTGVDMTTMRWNESIWPHGILLGLALIVIAIWRQDIRWTVGASPFLSPYLTGHTWAFAVLGLLLLIELLKPKKVIQSDHDNRLLWMRRKHAHSD